jgi:hypothetical protein
VTRRFQTPTLDFTVIHCRGASVRTDSERSGKGSVQSRVAKGTLCSLHCRLLDGRKRSVCKRLIDGGPLASLCKPCKFRFFLNRGCATRRRPIALRLRAWSLETSVPLILGFLVLENTSPSLPAPRLARAAPTLCTAAGRQRLQLCASLLISASPLDCGTARRRRVAFRARASACGSAGRLAGGPLAGAVRDHSCAQRVRLSHLA